MALLKFFFLLPLARAWTFRYTNATDHATIVHKTGILNCTKMDLAGGKLFSWDPEGSSLCITIFYDTKCEHGAGISCPWWKKNASTDFLAYQVYGDEQAATATISTAAPTPTSSSRTSTSSTSATSSPSVTASTTPAASTQSSSSSALSGGAIAGVVVGVVCAVLIIAALFFFFGRRGRKQAALANASNVPQGPYGSNAAGRPEADAPTSSKGISEKPGNSLDGGVRPLPGSRVLELAGQHQATELGNSAVHELDAPNENRPSRF
ncbi:hypothetical protein N7492_003803 [Penicillium capsulatum]|uniref:Uncharacterized protein n=1 Tax=Penicillium capsulatum TaxID=69766 RepID=A0A9W9LWJ4_9EURO|nr:hypothetical protein N7492_003803 [Penicillium capsulatum]KAJ6121613.1 hypothetical protein N7512_004078 [Penicillium capsulatum]